MCGIVGYVTGKNKSEYEKFFRQALITDVIRGFDSTGVIVGDDRGYKFIKKAVNAIDFSDMKSADKVMNSLGFNRPAFMIGHNRAATVGAVDSSNAHPFEHGDLVGVHNGTLRTYHRLEKHRDFSTDSEALYYNLSKRPIVEVLGDVKGAYALVWYDNAEGTVNIIKNDDRPLAIAKVKDEDTVLWASEEGMLRWLAGRNGITIENVLHPKVNVHLKFHLNSEEVSRFEFEQLDVKDNYPVYQPPAHANRPAYSGGNTATIPRYRLLDDLGLKLHTTYEAYVHAFSKYTTTTEYGMAICYLVEDPYIEVHLRGITKDDFDLIASKNINVSLTDIECKNGSIWTAVGSGKQVGKPKEDDATFHGPNNTFVNRDGMLALVKDGCMLCNRGISMTDFDFVDWIDSRPVCPECVAADVGELEA